MSSEIVGSRAEHVQEAYMRKVRADKRTTTLSRDMTCLALDV